MITGVLKNKRVLITAGSTWVPIDDVRVITNIFSGALGIEIANHVIKSGASVTLLLGPSRNQQPRDSKNCKTIRYRYYDELLKLVRTHVSSGKYDVMIHSAAVADYTPIRPTRGKIKSNLDFLTIHLKKTIKIVDIVKKICPKIFLVKFKLEVNVSKSRLLKIAAASMKHSRANVIVANDFKKMHTDHNAYIMTAAGDIVECKSKREITKKLIEIVSEKINHD